MFHQWILISVIVVSLPTSLSAQSDSTSPFQFIQREDVASEVEIQPHQLSNVERLQSVCDAQCQAQVMQMLMSVDSDLQLEFLSLDPIQQQQAVQSLMADARESVEMETLRDVILNDPQMIRFEQLRNQFQGIGSLLTDRVSNQLGLNNVQLEQINEIQNFGNELIADCQSNSALSQQQKSAEIQNIQNVVIDQSINILDNAQIGIYLNNVGNRFEFNQNLGDGNQGNVAQGTLEFSGAETTPGIDANSRSAQNPRSQARNQGQRRRNSTSRSSNFGESSAGSKEFGGGTWSSSRPDSQAQ
ncbi:MAG: hypothetical protein AAGA30_21445, partial [Planctomycetota bacterium]